MIAHFNDLPSLAQWSDFMNPLLFACWLTSSKYFLAAYLVSYAEFLYLPCHLSRSSSCFWLIVWRAISFSLIWTWLLPSFFSPKFLYWKKRLIPIHLLQTTFSCLSALSMPQSSLSQAEEFQSVKSFIVHLLSRFHRCNTLTKIVTLNTSMKISKADK